jgi:hypothetical protein
MYRDECAETRTVGFSGRPQLSLHHNEHGSDPEDMYPQPRNLRRIPGKTPDSHVSRAPGATTPPGHHTLVQSRSSDGRNAQTPLHPAGTVGNLNFPLPFGERVSGPCLPTGGEPLSSDDIAVARGGEDSPLRSRDLSFNDWHKVASPHYFNYGYSPDTIQPEMSSMPKVVAEMKRVHDALVAAEQNPGVQRSVRVFGLEMYLAGMAPTAQDPADLELLEYLWAISGDAGEEGPGSRG